jgi:hypothetical protein
MTEVVHEEQLLTVRQVAERLQVPNEVCAAGSRAANFRRFVSVMGRGPRCVSIRRNSVHGSSRLADRGGRMSPRAAKNKPGVSHKRSGGRPPTLIEHRDEDGRVKRYLPVGGSTTPAPEPERRPPVTVRERSPMGRGASSLGSSTRRSRALTIPSQRRRTLSDVRWCASLFGVRICCGFLPESRLAEPALAQRLLERPILTSWGAITPQVVR